MALDVQQHQQIHVSDDGGGDAVLSESSLTHLHQPKLVTLDLFHSEPTSSPIELDEPCPLPSGWQKFLNLKTGEIYYSNMSRNGRNPKLDLKLNLSPPRVNPRGESPNPSATSSPTSPPTSCVSSEVNNDETARNSNSPEATSMVLVGCPRCLMYVMLSEEDPKCPKCKSTVLLDFLNANNSNNTTKKTRKN